MGNSVETVAGKLGSKTGADFIPYWKTVVGEAEAEMAKKAVLAGHLSMGRETEEFERRFAQILGMPYAVCTTSGSAAIYMAVAAAGIGPGDEVLVPNRTFVATAHSVLLAGASVRLVDVHNDDPLIDEDAIESRVTKKTRAIIVVHLNGNSADMAKVRRVAKKHGLTVIEDAAQAFYSQDGRGFLGAQSDLGCFSLGVTKFITTGQGGVVVTRSAKLHEELLLARNHGVVGTYKAEYPRFGFNLKFSDVLASVGLVQLDKLEQKKKAHLRLYHYYQAALKGLDFLRFMPVKESAGNLPLWNEVLVDDRDEVVRLLAKENIQARPFLPDLDRSRHLGRQGTDFPNSWLFSRHGIFLPSGPDLPMEAAERTVAVLKSLDPKLLRKERLPRNA
ncbi:MAG: DegT/DnrJ/EryC1/StrS family aminotransferase [Elusimicrobia bacterium]|nr:DegT/DnrJ/EryC1/StrS family aminotransferase [Elusimicrobiota bacterium]